ncbi:MAG: hypothetical protein NC489_40580, partial [Ruminococcus flavefaciens]|nr:hypothetical protein [Ruminococcus flavefaciens]
MKEKRKDKKHFITAIAILAVLAAAGAATFCIRQDSSTGRDGQAGEQAESRTAGEGAGTEEAYQSLSGADRQTAEIYAELYETSREEAAGLYVQTGDWKKTGEQLEKEFFTIPENTKYQMEKDGYSMEDIEEAEKLSAETGIKAAELIEAKGKAADGKSWEEVKKEKGI